MAVCKNAHSTDVRAIARVPRRGAGPAAALALAVILGLLAGAPPARAVPRYAARYQQSCALCHHDPSGGGMRSAYAAQYLVPAELARHPTPAEDLQRLDPNIGRSLAIGFDLRTVHHYYDDGRTPGNFLQMQGTFTWRSRPRNDSKRISTAGCRAATKCSAWPTCSRRAGI